MFEFVKRLGKFLSINPEWTTSILPPNSFRVQSPGSITGYSPSQRTAESFTSGYSYFKRDSRREFLATIVIEPKTLAIPSDSSLLGHSAVEQNEIPPVPGKRRHYKKSDIQPPSNGYFPIINCD